MKKIRLASKFMMNILTILIVCIAVISVVSLIKSRKDEKYVAGIGRYKFLVVLSGSMSPVFNTYDLIVDKVYKGGELQPGEIITSWKEDVLVTHRIVDINREDNVNKYITKGDSNGDPDEELTDTKDIAGIYVFRVPYMGFVISKLRGPIGIGLVWAIFMYVVIMEIGVEMLNGKAKENKKLTK